MNWTWTSKKQKLKKIQNSPEKYLNQSEQDTSELIGWSNMVLVNLTGQINWWTTIIEQVC